jgi:hypothetical protein
MARAMDIPKEFEKDWAQFPAALRSLVEGEVAAGNAVIEFGHGSPAPPVGAYVMLAGPVRTRPRASTPEIAFYERNSSLYSGEFHDGKRWYFVLEAPLPPPPEPDMDALRAAYAPPPFVPSAPPPRQGRDEDSPRPASPRRDPSPFDRFRESLSMDFEKWKEGIGHDLEALRSSTGSARDDIERLLLTRGVTDWRDVESLLELGTPRALDLLRSAARSEDPAIALAVLRRAPELFDEETRTRQIVRGLETLQFFGGLSDALAAAEEHHPKPVIDALLCGALRRSKEGPVHFAALLFYLHGLADEAFDWNHRPFYLRFASEDPAERRLCFRELCAKLGVDPGPYEVAS